MADKMIADGLMTQDQAIEFLKKHEVLDDSFELDTSAMFQPNEQDYTQWVGNE